MPGHVTEAFATSATHVGEPLNGPVGEVTVRTVITIGATVE